jgi:hypothetical protein
MIRRVLFATAIAALVAVPAVLTQAQSGINIGGANINPTHLPSGGGNVDVKVNVSADSPIDRVVAKARINGHDGPNTVLKKKNGRYVGSVVVPANSRSSKVTAEIRVKASTASASRTKTVGKVTVGGFKGEPGGPPAPPEI